MATEDVERLVDRLATRLARVQCGACGGRGMHPWEGGPCYRCGGEKTVPMEGDELRAWIEAATQEIEAHCLDCKHRSIVPKGGVLL